MRDRRSKRRDGDKDKKVAEIQAADVKTSTEIFHSLSGAFTDITPEAAPSASPPAQDEDPASRHRRALKYLLRLFDLTMKHWKDMAPPDAPELIIMLDIYLNELDGRAVTVGDACIAAHAAHSTGLRAIDMLVQAQMLMRYTDPRDNRRRLLSLTAKSRLAVAAFVEDFITMAGRS